MLTIIRWWIHSNLNNPDLISILQQKRPGIDPVLKEGKCNKKSFGIRDLVGV